jgi:uncharacterized protein YaeQ
MSVAGSARVARGVLDWGHGAARSLLSSSGSLASDEAVTTVALTATIYNFDIELADSDRGVYESLALRVARHPSESEEYLMARVLAYTLEHTAGLEFSRGLSSPDEPALSVRDLTGAVQSWIEVGTPDATRLHKAAKAAPRVAVYLHKDPAQFVRRLAGERIHRADAIELYAIDRALLSSLVSRLERRMAFSLSIADRELYVSIGSETLTGPVVRVALEQP